MAEKDMIKYALANTLQKYSLADLQFEREENGDMTPLRGTDRPDPGAYAEAERIIAAIESEKGQSIDEIMHGMDVSITDFTAVIASMAMFGSISHPNMEEFAFSVRSCNFLTLDY